MVFDLSMKKRVHKLVLSVGSQRTGDASPATCFTFGLGLEVFDITPLGFNLILCNIFCIIGRSSPIPSERYMEVVKSPHTLRKSSWLFSAVLS